MAYGTRWYWPLIVAVGIFTALGFRAGGDTWLGSIVMAFVLTAVVQGAAAWQRQHGGPSGISKNPDDYL
jgi:hypothetical protein